MNPIQKPDPLALNRRVFFRGTGASVGLAALANLLGVDCANGTSNGDSRGALPSTHFAPKAKRIIYLFQSGGPAQQDLFDYKPLLNEMNGQELPPAVRGEQRLTGMSVNQSSLPLAGSHFKFAQYGQSGAWLSEFRQWAWAAYPLRKLNVPSRFLIPKWLASVSTLAKRLRRLLIRGIW